MACVHDVYTRKWFRFHTRALQSRRGCNASQPHLGCARGHHADRCARAWHESEGRRRSAASGARAGGVAREAGHMTTMYFVTAAFATPHVPRFRAACAQELGGPATHPCSWQWQAQRRAPRRAQQPAAASAGHRPALQKREQRSARQWRAAQVPRGWPRRAARVGAPAGHDAWERGALVCGGGRLQRLQVGQLLSFCTRAQGATSTLMSFPEQS